MTTEITIAEFQVAKRELELSLQQQINAAIEAFERDIGLPVIDLTLEKCREEGIGGDSYLYIVGVEVEVDLSGKPQV